MLHLKASRSVWNSKKPEDKSTEDLYFSDMPLGRQKVSPLTQLCSRLHLLNISSHSFPVAGQSIGQSELCQKLMFQSSEEEKARTLRFRGLELL